MKYKDLQRDPIVKISSKYPTGPGNAITKEMIEKFVKSTKIKESNSNSSKED